MLCTGVPEEPVPGAVAYKASLLTLAFEVARLSVEKPVGSCEIFLAFCVYCDGTMSPVPENPPVGKWESSSCRSTKVVMGTRGRWK